MRKAVAVPYVIALILGVAVIALVGIWFVMSGGKFTSGSSKTLCDNKFLQYCATNPAGDYSKFKTGTECANVPGTFERCNQVLSTCLPKGSGCPSDTSDCCSNACSGSPLKCS